jgi:hypothetical protein
MESGDQQKPVEYLCQVAHLRAEAFEVIKNRKLEGRNCEADRGKSKEEHLSQTPARKSSTGDGRSSASSL